MRNISLPLFTRGKVSNSVKHFIMRSINHRHDCYICYNVGPSAVCPIFLYGFRPNPRKNLFHVGYLATFVWNDFIEWSVVYDETPPIVVGLTDQVYLWHPVSLDGWMKPNSSKLFTMVFKASCFLVDICRHGARLRLVSHRARSTVKSMGGSHCWCWSDPCV